MTGHRIASISSIGPRFAAVAICGLALGAASIASAQTAETTPPPMKGACGEGGSKVSCPQMPQSPQQMTQAPSTEGQVLPPTGPQGQATSTTQTTAAEYTENVGAEKQVTSYRPNMGLLVPGTLLLGGAYGASAIVAAANSPKSSGSFEWTKHLYIPIAGPWITLGKDPCVFQGRCTGADKVNGALYIADGIAQGAGAILMLSSLFIPAHRETTKVAAKNNKVHIQSVTPVSYQGGAGIGASGTF
jgi:hypothetical protein